MRIGIIGGTYNPPHNGHIHAALTAKHALGLDLLLLIPACDPPHKTLPPGTPAAEQRLEMTRLAAAVIDAGVSDMEINRGGVSFTADTLKELKKLYGDAEFWLIVGTDMFLTVQEWKSAEYIMNNAGIAAVPRHVNDYIELERHAEFLCRRYKCDIRLLDVCPVDVSSTELRNNIYSEKSRVSIPETVYNYILENELYKKEG
ncbi:MAG: nicotinate (nicotinamide) nucleotide adenylyltransferase [Clostridiales bacterium]|jgi:nicotinate-nucleotide adenylyltransferase|nr:nicotinate (nicotinamide) nucleotide adenylyltransferase [Clostridiales bacterium]